MFCLDNREADLITLLGKENGCHIRQLPVADIWIGTEIEDENKEEQFQVGIIIERKSIRDLEASILDGRYREQRGRILAFCNNKKTQPMYILEGALSSSTGRLQKSAIMKIINRLVFHYQIPVMQTESVQETAELIQTLIAQWKEDPTSLQRTTDIVKVSDGLHVQKKANALDPKQFGTMCLAQCPGVSIKMAEVLINMFGSLKGVMDASPKEIEQIKVGNRKIGPIVSCRLHNILSI